MATIMRQQQKSNHARALALTTAKRKLDSLAPGTQILNTTTAARLNAAIATYLPAKQQVGVRQANLSENTTQKTQAIKQCALLVSHFIQVFNFGVARGKHPAAHRAHFRLDTESAALPPLTSEADILAWAGHLVSGDVTRLAAGGSPMTDPTPAEVQAQLATATTLFNTQSTLADALDTAQETLAALNKGTDSLIKRIWNEVESYYGEEKHDSMRANAREWGVIYTTRGTHATLTGLVKTADGQPLAGATATITESGATAQTNSEGRYTLKTILTGNITINITYGSHAPKETQAQIPTKHNGIKVKTATVTLGD